MKMSEEQFANRIQGLELSDAEVAILRKDLGLPFDQKPLEPHANPVLEKRIRMMAWSKFNVEEET